MQRSRSAGERAKSARLSSEPTMAHDRDVVPQVGGGEADADTGGFGRCRRGPRVEDGARLHHAGVARVQELQRGQRRGRRLVLAGDVGLPGGVVDAAHGIVGVVGEYAPAARPHDVVVRVDEPGVRHRPPGVDGAGRAHHPHHVSLRDRPRRGCGRAPPPRRGRTRGVSASTLMTQALRMSRSQSSFFVHGPGPVFISGLVSTT